MTYLRRLQLARAARELQGGGRILDIALANGYESQQAFHRAFVRMFGVTPKMFRQGHHHPSLMLKQPWRRSLPPLGTLPCRTARTEPRLVVGMGGVFDYEQFTQIEALWQRFHRRLPRSIDTYGVTLPYPEDPSRFRYYAAFEPNGMQVPKDFVSIATPAQQCLIFRYQGAPSGLLGAFNHIWGVSLPESGVRPCGIDFEHYLPGYLEDDPESVVEIHIPIADE